ncbi:ABC transporter permease ['Camptotheca acuminata' phytoplasma]|uniref:ABC transporter permease n=1 Tax='Camptotheca acuminata' phytoplasma TaxID=3239192 RepID=UPI00351A3465
MFKVKPILIFFKKNKNILFGVSFLFFLAMVILIIPLTNFYTNPYTSPFKPLQKISWKNLMGTDYVGHDLLSMVISGAKISLIISFICVLISSFLGTILGITSGYFRGIFDIIINFICDILVVFPDVILAIIIMFFLKKNIYSLIICLSISGIPGFIRLTRANTLVIKQKDFIKASKALGENDFKIILKHVLPNLWTLLITKITVGMSTIILAISGLGFIGLGLDPNVPEWGNILHSAKNDIRFHPHLFFAPFIFIFLTSLSFNLIGKGFLKYFNPKNQNK